MLIWKHGLNEGYAIVIWTATRGKVLKEVLGKAISEDFAIVYNDLTERYSIIAIGTGLNISNNVYTLKEMNSFLKKTDLKKYLEEVRKHDTVIEQGKQLFNRLMREKRWHDA